MIGYIAASHFTHQGSPKRAMPALGMLGLVGILLIPIVPIDGNSQNVLSGHPGLYALGASLSAALVLMFGLPHQFTNRYPIKTIEKLGEYSYSVYLAHFPIIILYLYKPFSGTELSEYSGKSLALLMLLIVLASALLYRLIESPARNPNSRIKLRWLIPASIAGIGAASTAGNALQENMYSKDEMQIFYAWEDRDDFRCGKLLRIMQPTAKVCDLTPNVNKPSHRALLVGNSHADSIKSALAKISSQNNTKLFLTVGMAPLMTGGQTTDELISYTEKHAFDALIIHHSPKAVTPEAIKALVDAAASKKIPVVLILPVPTWEAHIPKAHYAHTIDQTPLPEKDLGDYLSDNKSFLASVKAIQSPNYTYIETASVFCDTQCITRTEAGDLIYFDSNHLTLTGSTQLNDVFKQAISFIENAPL